MRNKSKKESAKVKQKDDLSSLDRYCIAVALSTALNSWEEYQDTEYMRVCIRGAMRIAMHPYLVRGRKHTPDADAAYGILSQAVRKENEPWSPIDDSEERSFKKAFKFLTDGLAAARRRDRRDLVEIREARNLRIAQEKQALHAQ